jgi:hypothetical protein
MLIKILNFGVVLLYAVYNLYKSYNLFTLIECILLIF